MDVYENKTVEVVLILHSYYVYFISFSLYSVAARAQIEQSPWRSGELTFTPT